MTRKCQYCNGWHFDFDCPNRPKSFSITSSFNQSPDSDSDSDEVVQCIAEQNQDSDPTDSDSDDAPSYSNHVAYSNGCRLSQLLTQTLLLKAENFAVQQIPSPDAVGTGISYLGAEPCPVKAWIGMQRHGSAPLYNGVIDSGGPSIIQ